METLVEAPLSSANLPFTEESIVIALREILPAMNANTATLKAVMEKLAARFGVEFSVIRAQWRSRIKALLPDLLELCATEGCFGDKDDKAEDNVHNETLRRRKNRMKNRITIVDSSDEENDDGDGVNSSEASVGNASNLEETDDGKSDEDNFRKRKSKINGNKRSKGLPPAKKSRSTKQPDSAGLASLKELGRAAGVMNPQLYKVLNNAASNAEAEKIMRDRLHDAGISFAGTYPSSRDISAAKRKHAKDKELEGIDTSLIISDGRPRRGSAQRISYKEERISGEEDNFDEEEDDDKESVVPEDSDSDSSEASF